MLAMVLVAGTAADATSDDLTTAVEGHVFDKFTGVPLEGRSSSRPSSTR